MSGEGLRGVSISDAKLCLLDMEELQARFGDRLAESENIREKARKEIVGK